MLIFLTCTKRIEEKSRGNTEIIDFEKVEETDSLLSPRTLFADAEYLLLKAPDTLNVTKVSKIRELNGNLLLLDGNRNIIFSFNKSVEFISLVGAIGEGPSEFREVTDFDVQGDYIYTFSRVDFAIYKFNSDFVFEEKIKFHEWGWQMSVLNSGNLAFYSLLGEGEDEFNINILNKHGNTIEKRMTFDRDGQYKGLNYSGFINGQFYTYPLSSFIYKINEGGNIDSIIFEINFPGRFPEEKISNWNAFKESELNKKYENILTKLEFGKKGVSSP